jgi:hypothetical protein
VLHFTPADSSPPFAVPIEDIQNLRRFAGRRGRIEQGALWGTVIGAALGLLAGMGSTIDESRCGEGLFDCVYLGPTLLGGAIGATGGAMIGVGVGAMIRKDRWVPIEPADLPGPSPR